MNTKHACVRIQQRAIPPLVDRLLDEFGEENYDGHGGVRVYFSHRSVRKMKRKLGTQPVQLLGRYLSAYKVESSRDGAILTNGWAFKRMRRR